MSTAGEVWSENLKDELLHWKRTILDDGESARILRARAEVRPLAQWTRNEIRNPGSLVRILDVGAGPLTSHGTEWPDHEVDLVPLDPLADEYNALLSEFGIQPPVPTLKGSGEALGEMFGPDSFDFVVTTNALDHCADPVRVIQEMVLVAKPGSVVFMNHFADVAELEQHAGLHQWNLRPVEGDMLIEGYGQQLLLSDVVKGNEIDVIDRGADFVARVIKS